MDSQKTYEKVQEHYGSIARAQNIKYSGTIAKAFGYSEEELSSIPKESNLGLSCGNPLAIASIREVNQVR
jgi:arsenite methyltransferase